MVLEWIRRREPRFDKELREYLFTDRPDRRRREGRDGPRDSA